MLYLNGAGGAAMIGLQEMLLQETPDGEAIICPTWPKEWDVEFKLHSSKGAVYCIPMFVEPGSKQKK